MSDPVDMVLDLLERERMAILSGQYADLPPLAKARAQAMDRLAPRTDLARVHRAAGRNATLLQAARRGIASVIARHKSNGKFDTYTAEGARLQHGGLSNAVEKKL